MTGTTHRTQTDPAARDRRPRRRRPGPFPVTIVQAAATVAPAVTADQHGRRSTASQIAAEFTNAARQGRAPCVGATYDVMWAIDIRQVTDIIADAPRLAADPAPGSLLIGRDLRGRPVAVLLHADTWSLVITPCRDGHTPTSFVVIDGHRSGFDLDHLVWSFDDDTSVHGVEWTDMLAAVLTAAT
ncbi:hypothetical protein [Rhizomonospora bruguierae]|uniref:hypothetical protein n=1 Tax=Rhizomonospora bruguierae TaxID=1581705 RepID=UPI001BD1670B|nr:hypothetical protein [Micromonospora sp. NBRC 107566]